MRLFCFPYAGGGASIYRNWTEELHSEFEVWWVQWPGRENRIRERPLTSVQELVSALVDGIAPWLDRPYAFYGHSVGAKVAFETIRALRRNRQSEPCHLFVGASRAPQLPWPYAPLHLLEEQEFIRQIQKRYGGVPREILEDAELRALLIPTLRADVQLMETYRYTQEAPLDCAITAFGGSTDYTIEPSALEAWGEQTSGSFRLHTLPGDHFFLHSARRQVLSAIVNDLT